MTGAPSGPIMKQTSSMLMGGHYCVSLAAGDVQRFLTAYRRFWGLGGAGCDFREPRAAHNRPMAKRRKSDQSVTGVVEWFDSDEGWGAITAPEVPGGCFVHFSHIQLSGYRELRAGQRVRFTFEAPGQDGYPYRARAVWTVD
ncbi:cold shock domain-containing protein [Actinopolymorpha sp. B9G3]|uniref:cold shock domain-containing protein n=1 Tax=Actinopolymorpha sp. B9G3 TaxID=3158970 RepID=UPI0032D98CC5